MIKTKSNYIFNLFTFLGKYVGSRPVTISKATTGVGAVEIGDKKARAMDLLKKAKSGTKPYERAKLVSSLCFRVMRFYFIIY